MADITESEARQLIYDVYHQQVGHAQPVSVEDFFKEKIGESLEIPGQLENWPNFLRDSIAADIQGQIRARGRWIMGFDSQWLDKNKNKTWESLIQHMAASNLIPIV